MKKPTLEEIIKNIDWNRAILTIIPLLQPFIIFGAWLTFSRINTKASLVSKLIAIGESIPTLDLNVPKPVVLASLYDSTDDALILIEKVIDTLFDMPDELREKFDKLKEESKKQTIGYIFPVIPIFEGIAEIFGFALPKKPEKK